MFLKQFRAGRQPDMPGGEVPRDPVVLAIGFQALTGSAEIFTSVAAVTAFTTLASAAAGFALSVGVFYVANNRFARGQ